MGLTRSTLICALWGCMAFSEFASPSNQGTALGSAEVLRDGVVEPRSRHRLQLLFPLLLRISTRLATLVPTALMALFGIFLFVVFSKKAFILSLFALLLSLSGKYKGKGDDIYIHKVNSYPDYNGEEHIHYHHREPIKFKKKYHEGNRPYNKWKKYVKRNLPEFPLHVDDIAQPFKPLPSHLRKQTFLEEGFFVNDPPAFPFPLTYGDDHRGITVAEMRSVDNKRLSPYERQKIKDTWLSVPRTYQEPTINAPTLVRKTPFGLSVPALKAKCSPHTELLAVARNPLPQMHYVTKAEKEAQRELEEDMTKEELRWLHRKYFIPTPTGVKKAALLAKTTPRIEAMAVARLCILNETKQNYFNKLNNQQRQSVLRNIQEHYNVFYSNYPPEADKIYVIAGGSIVHASCSGKLPDHGKRVRYICELNKNQRRNFRRRMKLLGLPKKVILPDKGPDRGPKKRLKDFEPWITLISQPRYNILNEKPYNPFRVKSSAKFYTPTERILILAKPREVPAPPPLTDFEGNELPPRREWSYNSRRRIIASPRTLELATPKFVKKKAAEDVKEDPFAVPRRALTAYCSPRTIELAEPRRR